LYTQTSIRILRYKFKNMKTAIKVLAGLLVGFGLIQLTDLAFYLMNQPDTFVFNIGLVVFGIMFIAFGYLGLYLMKVLKPEEKVKGEIKQEKEE
jgi:hypothetical protein